MKVGNVRNVGIALSLILLAAGLGLRFYSSIASVSNNPFPADWSESWRIFEAASVYGRLVFEQKIPFPWLEPARAMLEGLVFLIPGSEIWMFRLWKAILMLGTTLLVAIISFKTSRRYQFPAGRPGKFISALIICWGALFLLQPPFNYHVLLGIMLVLIFFDTSRSVRTVIVIFIASLWEGLGRINWFLMPALVASALYFMEVPVKGKTLFKYLQQPFLWCLAGAGASFLTYALSLQLNGHVSTIFSPSMEYHYFTFKLWPNPGFDLGLIPGMVVLSLPLGILVLWTVGKWGKRIPWLRILGLMGILLVLFVGSTIVSLRSGGGYDLHNYDTFILILFLVGLYIGTQAVKLEDGLPDQEPGWLEKPFMVALLLLVPFYFSLRDLPNPVVMDESHASKTITEMNVILQNPDRAEGSILYIDQRQLLVYGQVNAEDIFIPYDKIYLMEMAMANYMPYLDGFQKDISAQKFSYIVSDPLNIWPQDGRAVWGYENNVYIEYVSLPVLEYYQPVYIDRELNVAIYAPISNSDD